MLFYNTTRCQNKLVTSVATVVKLCKSRQNLYRMPGIVVGGISTVVGAGIGGVIGAAGGPAGMAAGAVAGGALGAIVGTIGDGVANKIKEAKKNRK